MEQGDSNEQAMRDLLANIESYARGMWRFRWRAIAVVWVLSLGGWYAVYTLPDVYEANARIYVDTQNALKPLLQGIAATSNVMNEVTVVTREMLSRPNLAAVARETDLDLRTRTDADFESLLTSLQTRIEVKGNRDNIFSIAFRDRDRDKAVAVVASLVNTFVEKSLGGNRSETGQAQEFLEKQISEYEQRLTAAEDRLADFKRENVAMMPGKGGDYFARLQEARSSLGHTRSRLRLAEERRAELKRQIEGEEPVFGIMPAVPVGQPGGGGMAAAKISQLESQLAELRLRYTDKHPRIGQILDTIELLEQQELGRLAAAERAADGFSAPPPQANPLDLNPVYQNMRIQLTNTEVEIASLRAELAEQRASVKEQQRLVDTVPQVEAELNRLNRDYDVVKSRYVQLLQRLETANIGEDVGRSIDEVQFRIIDPPFSALKPAGPKRELFLTMVFVMALGAGGALAFLINLLHPVFFSSRAVSTITGMPVLGTAGLLLAPAEKRAKKVEKFGLAFAMGVLAFSFVLVSLFAEQWSVAVRGLSEMIS